MSQPIESDLHAGLSGLGMTEDWIDPGEGISLRKTYAHLRVPILAGNS
jgi:hypothetical protein